MTKEFNLEKIKKAKGVFDDLIKFVPKVNEMMVETCRGDCPQILKLLLIKKLVDGAVKGLEKKMGSKAIIEGEEFLTRITEKIGEIKHSTNLEEAESTIYGKGKDR